MDFTLLKQTSFHLHAMILVFINSINLYFSFFQRVELSSFSNLYETLLISFYFLRQKIFHCSHHFMGGFFSKQKNLNEQSIDKGFWYIPSHPILLQLYNLSQIVKSHQSFELVIPGWIFNSNSEFESILSIKCFHSMESRMV